MVAYSVGHWKEGQCQFRQQRPAAVRETREGFAELLTATRGSTEMQRGTSDCEAVQLVASVGTGELQRVPLDGVDCRVPPQEV